MIKSKERENINTPMETCNYLSNLVIKENIKMIIWKEKETLNIPMEMCK